MLLSPFCPWPFSRFRFFHQILCCLSLSEASAWFNSSDVAFRFRGLPLEVYSEVPLQAGDLTIPRYVLTEVAANQWAEISLANSFDQSGDVYVRGVYQNGLKQDWSRVAVAEVELVPEIVTDELAANEFYQFIQFDSASELRAEYADDPQFESFEKLTADEATRFNNAAYRWGDMVPVTLFRSYSNVNTNVFKADLGTEQPYLAYSPGDGRGYDVIFNSNSSVFDASPESTYQLLQAIGVGIDMRVSDSVDRRTSVMGTLVRQGFEDVYPSTMRSRSPWGVFSKLTLPRR